MGTMNLLKGKWDGKVGQTVGSKWKDKATIRTYSVPSNPNTQAQQDVRNAFKSITSFTALFTDQIKYLSALDTSGMSLRNAIVKLNGDMIAENDFNKADLLISKGGLQKVNGETATEASGKITITWTAPTATNFTSRAVLVAVFVQEETGLVEVKTASATAGTIAGDLTFSTGNVDVYVYYLDYRGSNKVASLSDYVSVSVA